MKMEELPMSTAVGKFDAFYAETRIKIRLLRMGEPLLGTTTLFENKDPFRMPTPSYIIFVNTNKTTNLNSITEVGTTVVM